MPPERAQDRDREEPPPQPHVAEALEILRGVSGPVGVAYSVGKDSLACLDLVSRARPGERDRTYGFHAYRVPGLAVVEESLAFAAARWGTEFRRYPHPELVRALGSRFAPSSVESAIAEVTLTVGASTSRSFDYRALEKKFRQECGVEWIVWGYRLDDARAVRIPEGGIDRANKRLFPLYRWERVHVLGYLVSRSIPFPPGVERGEGTSLDDLSPATLEWLAMRHPADFARVLSWFPYGSAHMSERHAGVNRTLTSERPRPHYSAEVEREMLRVVEEIRALSIELAEANADAGAGNYCECECTTARGAHAWRTRTRTRSSASASASATSSSTTTNTAETQFLRRCLDCGAERPLEKAI